MKSHTAIACSICVSVLLPCWAAADGGAIRRVVVYADRAQVTRERTVSCSAGEAEFSGLPSTLDGKTLQAALRGGGRVLGVTWEEEAGGPRPQAAELQRELRQIDTGIAKTRAAEAEAKAVGRKLQSFSEHLERAWGHEASGPRAFVARWNSGFDLLRREQLALARKRRAAQIRRRELDRQRREVMASLRRIERKRRRTTVRARVLLACKGRATVRLSYVVPGATWRMSYEVRAEPRTGRVTLVAQGIVQQGTGEDWNGVRLAVSTANLQRKNVPPGIRPMRVSTRDPGSRKKVLARRYEVRRHLEARKADAPAPAAALEVGPKLALEVSRPVTITSDGREVVVRLAQKRAKGAISYEAVPKLLPFVYHRVSLTNPFAFHLLPGEVALFRGGSFVGRTRLEMRAPGEPFALSLGVDNQLQIARYVKKERLEQSGREKRIVHRYRIELGNWTKKPQRIRVRENVPVAQVDEIKIALDDGATPPTAWDKKDGMLSWELQLRPQSKKTITLAYTITVPETYNVSGYR